MQLDGGILKYFEDCGGEHYEGECFVFDQRVGVDPSLAETDNVQCFACLSPLNVEDQNDPRYVPNESCPYCYVRNEERMQQAIAERESAIRLATNPLPGSKPYDNYRPVNISAKYDGQTLLDTLYGIFSHVRARSGNSVANSNDFKQTIISQSVRSKSSEQGSDTYICFPRRSSQT